MPVYKLRWTTNERLLSARLVVLGRTAVAYERTAWIGSSRREKFGRTRPEAAIDLLGGTALAIPVMFKLGCLVENRWVEHSHPSVYALQDSQDGDQVVLATAPKGDPVVLQKLADRLTPPFFLLYVLHTPRGEAEPGRYQSEEIDREALLKFLSRFDRFLRSDGRFDLWLHSPSDRATIVWDRHNLVHCYDRAVSFAEALRALGFQEGNPVIPAPHQHHYRPSSDEDARLLLASLSWSRSPLRQEDEQ